MHVLTFYHLGNADCCRIDLDNGKKLLVDYANTRDAEDAWDLRADLPTELRQDLRRNDRDYFDVVAFTHLDQDHIQGASEFFYLDHATKYQDEERTKIKTLWVPAAAIIEEGAEDEARIIRQEARYRLKKGRGIRVFSKPDLLREWLESQDLDLESRLHLITDAGKLAPEFSLETDGVEFFIHSPFASRLDQTDEPVRNIDCLAFHIRLQVDAVATDALFLSDCEHEAIDHIVEVTMDHGNEERLNWHVMKIAHHSSYLSLGPDKGEEETKPVPRVKRLLERHSQDKAVLVSSSNPVPNEDTDLPPHRQAAAYYRRVASSCGGRYVVTMEHPSKARPKPLVIRIDGRGHTVELPAASGAVAAIGASSPRAG